MALTLGTAVIELAANSARFRADLQRAHGDFNRFTSQVRSSARALGGAIGLGSLTLLTKQALDAGDALVEMAKRTGIGVEALQELQYAAKISGVEVGDLETGMRKLAVNLSEAARGGSKEAAELFQRLGVSATTSAGGLKTVEDALGDIADAITRTKNPTEQADLAIKAFGRSGTQLLPLLQEGRAGMAALAVEARKAGAVMSTEAVEATARAKDEFDRLAKVLNTTLVEAVAAATPALSVFFELVREGARGLQELFDRMRPADTASLEELANRIVDLQAKIAEARRTGGVGMRGGGLVPEPGASGVEDMERELDRLRTLLRERQRIATASMTVTGGGATFTGLTDAQKDQIIKGWVDVAESAITAYEDELRALERIHDERTAAEKKLFDDHRAGTLDAIEAEIDAYEAGLREYARLRDEQSAVEVRQLEQHNAGVIAAIEAEIDAYEDGLREVARIQDERDRPFKELADTMRIARVEGEAFGDSVNTIRVRFDALRDAMRALIGQQRENTEEFRRLKKEYDDLKPFIAFQNVVETAFQAIDRAVATSVQGVLLGTTTIADAFRNLGQSIALSLVESALKTLLNSLKDALIQFLQDKAVRDFLIFLARLGLSLLGSTAGNTSPQAGPGSDPGLPHSTARLPPGAALTAGGGDVHVQIVNQSSAQVTGRAEQTTGADGIKRLRIVLVDMMKGALAEGSLDSTLKATHGLSRRGVSR